MDKNNKQVFKNCGCYNCNDSTIHNYGRTVPSKFYNYTDNDLYFGMEVEVGVPDADEVKKRKLAQMVKHHFGHLVELKYDGSIGRYGFEIVTQPISATTFKRFLDTDKFASLANAGLKSYDLKRVGISAGVHIHMSRKAFTPLMIVKLGQFFMGNEQYINKIANRSNCQYANYDHSEFNDEMLLQYAKGYCNSHSDRYMPLNFENSQTIEVRVFRGTLNTDRLNAYVEFLAALYEFIKVTPVGYDNLTFGAFATYVGQHKETYAYLYNLEVIRLNERGGN